MGARHCDSTLGRFYAVDPIDGGSLNNYDYAAQDPVNGYDLDGLRYDNYACRTDPTGSWGNETDRFCTEADIPAPAAYDHGKDYSSDHGAFLEFKGIFNKAAYNHDLCYGSQIYEK